MMYRSSRQVFCKKGVLKRFAKFTGKHLCQSLFFNKVAGLRPAALLKKESPAQVYSCEFCETFSKTYFVEHLRTAASEIKFSVRRTLGLKIASENGVCISHNPDTIIFRISLFKSTARSKFFFLLLHTLIYAMNPSIHEQFNETTQFK